MFQITRNLFTLAVNTDQNKINHVNAITMPLLRYPQSRPKHQASHLHIINTQSVLDLIAFRLRPKFCGVISLMRAEGVHNLVLGEEQYTCGHPKLY